MPKGDVLVCCGDISHRGEFKSLENFNQWLGTLSYKHILFIAGNHDLSFESPRDKRQAIETLSNAQYMENHHLVIDGIKFVGMAHSLKERMIFPDAFMTTNYSWIMNQWEKIQECDVLITHRPAKGILDMNCEGSEEGCPVIATYVSKMKPRLHLFGDIHEARGTAFTKDTTSINCAVVTRANQLYQYKYPLPYVVEVPENKKNNALILSESQ